MSDCCMSDTPNVSVKNCFAIDVLKSLKKDIAEMSYNCEISTIDRYRVEKAIDNKIAELNGVINEEI